MPRIDGWAIVELPHQRLRRMLESAGLSNGDVADALGVTSETVSQWRKGSQEPDDFSMDCIVELLESRDVRVTPEWMRYGEIPAEAPRPSRRR